MAALEQSNDIVKSEKEMKEITDEVADVFIYLIRLSKQVSKQRYGSSFDNTLSAL